jgi:hypothetical protein
MPVHLGVNILSQHLSSPATLNRDLAALYSPAHLVMDNPDLSGQLRQQLAGPIVHRRWFDLNADGDGDDDEIWMRMTPQQFLSFIASDARPNVIQQVHNEPVIDAGNVDAFVRWNVELLNMPRPFGLGVGCFSVGNPHEDLIRSGRFDPMLRALRAQDALILHEYFVSNPDMPAENPWRVGRVQWWAMRMQVLGTLCKRIIISEYGRDVNGGHRDGWRFSGMSSSAYADALIRGMNTYQRISDRYGVQISAYVFCFGRGHDNHWQSFNIEDEPEILSRIRDYNQHITQPVTKPLPPSHDSLGTPVRYLASLPAGQYVNFRSVPEVMPSTDIGDVRDGDTIWVRPKTWTGNGYRWASVKFNGRDGWVAADLIRFAPYETTHPMQYIETVPYFSQISVTARLYNNDCGPACARMVLGHVFAKKGLQPPVAITVDDMSRDSSLASADRPIGLAEVQKLLMGYGVRSGISRTLNPDGIVSEIDRGNPVIVLVNYDHLKSGEAYGHFVVVYGYSSTHFLIHDPLYLGAGRRVARLDLDRAMSDLKNIASVTYQGLVLL